jgi:hypothetical protein
VQIYEIVAIAAIALAVVAIAGLALVLRRLQRYHRNQHVILGSRGNVDIIEHVSALDEKLSNVRVALEDLMLVARDHDVRLDGTLSRVGIVRFDAYHDLGGRQSTVVAFLNSHGDGVTITTVVSRDFARMYVKLLKAGVPDIPLAPEEAEAVEQARGSAPFVLRPRAEGGTIPEESAEDEAEALPEGAPIANGLPGRRPQSDREVARENRMRRREGMPLVDDKVLPSARGWDSPETLTPPGASLAERFVQERKQSLGQGDDDTEEWLSGTAKADEDSREL